MKSRHNYFYLGVVSVTWFMFSVLSYLVWDANEYLISINQNIYERIISSSIAEHRGFWTLVTTFGSVQVLGVLTTVSLLYFIYKKDKADTYLYFLSMLGGIISVGILKHFTASERPGFVYAIEETFSFPSGHTALSSIFLILTSYLYTKNKKHIHKKIVIGLAVALSLLIAVSRLYLGEHWASDVLGGYIFAIGWSATFIYFYTNLIKKRYFK